MTSSNYWGFRLPPEIKAKLASWRGGQQPQELTLEEIRTVVRAIHVQMLLEPRHDPDLEVSLKRFAALARKRRRQMRGRPPIVGVGR